LVWGQISRESREREDATGDQNRNRGSKNMSHVLSLSAAKEKPPRLFEA
jgi:hypothetical protein